MFRQFHRNVMIFTLPPLSDSSQPPKHFSIAPGLQGMIPSCHPHLQDSCTFQSHWTFSAPTPDWGWVLCVFNIPNTNFVQCCLNFALMKQPKTRDKTCIDMLLLQSRAVLFFTGRSVMAYATGLLSMINSKMITHNSPGAMPRSLLPGKMEWNFPCSYPWQKLVSSLIERLITSGRVALEDLQLLS